MPLEVSAAIKPPAARVSSSGCGATTTVGTGFGIQADACSNVRAQPVSPSNGTIIEIIQMQKFHDERFSV